MKWGSPNKRTSGFHASNVSQANSRKVLGFVGAVPSVYCSQIVPFVTSIWNATVIIPYATIVTFSATSCSWWVGSWWKSHVMLVDWLGGSRVFFGRGEPPRQWGSDLDILYTCSCIYITRFNILEWRWGGTSEDNNWSNLPASTSSMAPWKGEFWWTPLCRKVCWMGPDHLL